VDWYFPLFSLINNSNNFLKTIPSEKKYIIYKHLQFNISNIEDELSLDKEIVRNKTQSMRRTHNEDELVKGCSELNVEIWGGEDGVGVGYL
jgi:hypothetical protein